MSFDTERFIVEIQNRPCLWDASLSESLQKRWKSIRGCNTREVNRQKSVKSGSGCGSRKSEYIYYKQLQFLQIRLRPLQTLRTLRIILSMSHITNQTSTRSKEAENKFIAVLNKCIESREKCEVGNQDEDKFFLLSLVGTLKKVPPNRKMATKIKIMTILNEEFCNVQTQNNRDYWSSPPPDLPSRSYNREYSTSRRGFLSTMGFEFKS
ncbi:unnamed protein product [Pieris brassicae]|uniref:BESS domain-containing protein n=1 Tax=Pieris brassicae TaxID=7116 RepID=A0A9P0T1U6_PIEBR|nr:unnamed protein product [Pieris brassicae]